ncbi:MAG: calcium-binding protein, partial [Gallionella sp.]
MSNKVTVVEAEGGKFKLDIVYADISHVEVVDVDFVLFLKDGSSVVLVNAAMDAMSASPSAVLFANNSDITLPSLMDEVGSINIGDAALPTMSSLQPFQKADSEQQQKGVESNLDLQQVDNQDLPDPAPEGLAPTNAEAVNVIQQMIDSGTLPASTVAAEPINPGLIIYLPAVEPSSTTPEALPVLPFDAELQTGIFNWVEQGSAGNTIFGGGGDISTDPIALGYSSFAASPGAHISAETLNGTTGADVIHSDYSGYLGAGFAKLVHLKVAGIVASVDTLTVSGVPAGWSIEGATDLGGGTWSLALGGQVVQNEFDVKLMYTAYEADAANPVHEGPVDVTFSVGVTDVNGTAASVNQTLHLAIADVTTASDMSYVDGSGQTVFVLPAQGNPDYVLAGSGSDTVFAGLGNDTVFGEAGIDTLYGESGNDYLDGGTGADTLVGSTGDDTYIVDDAGDVITEVADEGIDTVQSSINYTLGNEVENLTLTGTAVSGTGNSAANILTGNASDNTLDGGLGTDTLIGGAGNDTYIVDDSAEVVTEALNEGTDTVQS